MPSSEFSGRLAQEGTPGTTLALWAIGTIAGSKTDREEAWFRRAQDVSFLKAALLSSEMTGSHSKSSVLPAIFRVSIAIELRRWQLVYPVAIFDNMRAQISVFAAALVIAIAILRTLEAAELNEELSAAKTAQQIIDSARDSIVIIKQAAREGREGVGTGFVVSRDGLIATSLHVIGEARPLTVTFADGSTANVTEIHAWDRKLDLAVIRVGRTNLSRLRLGDSDNLKQGASVVAIGNPQGLNHSIVQGVVSAMRDFEFGPMIQLAIPIEPGNSGGPLLDMRGRVQGILNIKSLLTDNLGFAIPINAIKPLLEKPNSVPMEKWLAIGALNNALWQPIMGAQWRQRTGMITVEDSGRGFGGRALCLSKKEVPELPYEVAVTVLLDDESGAAGLAFA